MYSYCTIRWVDDSEEQDVLIASDEQVVPEEDDKVFFYGLTPEDLDRLIESGEPVNGEWVVVERHD